MLQAENELEDGRNGGANSILGIGQLLLMTIRTSKKITPKGTTEQFPAFASYLLFWVLIKNVADDVANFNFPNIQQPVYTTGYSMRKTSVMV